MANFGVVWTYGDLVPCLLDWNLELNIRLFVPQHDHLHFQLQGSRFVVTLFLDLRIVPRRDGDWLM